MHTHVLCVNQINKEPALEKKAVKKKVKYYTTLRETPKEFRNVYHNQPNLFIRGLSSFILYYLSKNRKAT